MANSNDTKRGLRTSYTATLVGVSLVLFMISLVIGGYVALESIQKQAKENLQVDIFFRTDLNDSDIKQIEQKLRTWPQFKEVLYVSKERALEEFQGLGNAEEILEILDGENPIPTNISYKPIAAFANPEGMKELKDLVLVEFGNDIEEISYQESAVENVNLGFNQFAYLFIAVAALLILIAIAMINNTIKLALYSKRFSIKTMQLVGARSSYIRRPFIGQGIGIGILGGVIGMAIFTALIYVLNNILETITINFSLIEFGFILAVLVSIGILLTLFSTIFALNKYLRMKLDDLY